MPSCTATPFSNLPVSAATPCAVGWPPASSRARSSGSRAGHVGAARPSSSGCGNHAGRKWRNSGAGDASAVSSASAARWTRVQGPSPIGKRGGGFDSAALKSLGHAATHLALTIARCSLTSTRGKTPARPAGTAPGSSGCSTKALPHIAAPALPSALCLPMGAVHSSASPAATMSPRRARSGQARTTALAT